MKLKTLTLSLLLGLAASSAFAEDQYIVRVPANVQVAAPEALQPPTSYASCLAYLNENPGASSGNYILDPDADGPTPEGEYYCDMERHGGGWTLVVRAQQNSSAHANTNAVGSLIFPDQSSVAKLSDALINAFPKAMYRITNSAGTHSVFFDTSDTFSAVRQVSNKASISYETPVWEGPFYDGNHKGLNTNEFLRGSFGRNDSRGAVYAGMNDSDECRRGIYITSGAAGWCGAGDAATVWIR